MLGENKGTVLIVEDAEGFREVYRDVLASDGYVVLEAKDGETGVELATDRKPSLILLDLVLPKLDGFEVLETIRSEDSTKDIPVIILSVLGEKESIQEALQLGANDYTIKGSVSPRDVLMKINTLLAKDRTESYKLFLGGVRGDATRLEKDMGMGSAFTCPSCRGTIVMELLPDKSREPDHWFSAHFVCSNCRKSF